LFDIYRSAFSFLAVSTSAKMRSSFDSVILLVILRIESCFHFRFSARTLVPQREALNTTAGAKHQLQSQRQWVSAIVIGLRKERPSLSY
jgi:hypothetical protein